MAKLICTLDEIDWSDMPRTEIKFAEVTQSLLDSLDIRVRDIVLKMMSLNTLSYDHCLLDVKVRNLKTGDCGCFLKVYHYDWVKSLDHPNKHETHFIYTNINGTEFEDGTKCIDNSIYQYGRESHRGSIMLTDTKRVMIRLSYVDKKHTRKAQNTSKQALMVL